MDQSEIDEIAARRVRPFLDEINEKAEKERERLAALKAEEERRREEAEGKRAQEREIKENLEKLKGKSASFLSRTLKGLASL
jgi:predicted nuclease with TOPRIM domain